jgi:proteasome lid subunit RPN8/RPN11
MIIIEPIAQELITDDALRTYPDECCGFFFGNESPDDRTISEIQIVANAKVGDKRKRFEIAPKDYLQAEEFADKRNLQLLGVYHSHPDHPAIPSEQDRQSAQPWFSYIIISVTGNKIDDIRSWRLNDDFQFEEEKIKFEHITT